MIMESRHLNSIIKSNIKLPRQRVDGINCKVFGLSDDQADLAGDNLAQSKLKAIESELDRIRAEMQMLSIYGIAAMLAILVIVVAAAIVVARYQRRLQ